LCPVWKIIKEKAIVENNIVETNTPLGVAYQ
jgi:hypothetical protein